MTTRLWNLIQQWLDAQFFRVTQSQLADKLGVTRSAVSQWKHGDATPRPEHLAALARLTRIPYVDLRTALVEDLGYLVEEVGDDVCSAPMNQAGGSPADDLTLHVETQDEPFGLPTPEEAEQGGSRDRDRQDRPESGPGAD